jgi:RNA polymerase sigma-70 factor (ECF subfamily)
MLEAEIRRLVESGEAGAAAEALYREHAGDVRRMLALRAPAGTAVEDLAQEVWAAVSHALPSFRFESCPRVWLLSIARRKAADAFRRKGPSIDSLGSEQPAAAADAVLLGVRQQDSPSRELHVARRRQVLAEALAHLSTEERELVELRFVVGLRPAEIVEVLGLDARPNTISQRLVRLVRGLRHDLEDHEELDSYRPHRPDRPDRR